MKPICLLFYHNCFLNNQRMGAFVQPSGVVTLSQYCQQIHPVEATVDVYRLRGEQLFIFEKKHTPALFTKVAEKIASLKSPHLCAYHGNLFTNPKVQTRESCGCQQERESSSFWTYQNHTLINEIQLNLEAGRYPPEQKLWQMIGGLTQAATILMNHGLYLDFNMQNVHISPLKIVQVYWGNAKIGNGHRLYYQQILGQQSTLGAFAPQELKAIRTGKVTSKLDLQKCVMHSLGLLMLMFASNIDHYQQFYDFDTFEIRTAKVVKMMSQLQKRYSQLLVKTLGDMLVDEPSKRLNFSSLKQLLDRSQRESMYSSQTDVRVKQQMESETCASSKVSIKYYHH